MQCAKNKARLQAAIDFAESEELFKASVNERTLHFINCQLKMQIKKSRGRRTLMALLAHAAPMHCGINENLIRSLGESVQKMDPIDKHCVLLGSN
ncbi:hypothetical protein QE152_g40937 [Popillia japonica]|uniref:Uncharacterized protein n=1 Tax=Popillia japonica TaxID=7064 RepID=A0AAW1HEW8_POPJA